MASIGHVSVGLLAGRLHAGPRGGAATSMIAFGALSLAPDLDVLPLAFGVEDSGILGHRGVSHTLAFAIVGALVAAVLTRRSRAGPLHTGVLVFLTLASHGVLDAATTDTRGVPMLWPLVTEGLASPMRPIPEAPTGMAFISLRGLEVAAVELVVFLPTTLAALLPARLFRPTRLLEGARTAVFVTGLALSLLSARLWLEGSAAVARVWSKPDRSTVTQASTR